MRTEAEIKEEIQRLKKVAKDPIWDKAERTVIRDLALTLSWVLEESESPPKVK